jgi:mono/diheme cytochrome c family protein
VRAGLPIGMHLTTDPFTRVPFVVTSCALCHTERVRWPGGERVVVGLGNKRVRVHAYDAAYVDVAERADLDETRVAALAVEEARARAVPWPASFRGALVHGTIDALRVRAKARAAFVARVRAGPPGRVAAIESFALALGLALAREVKTAPEIGWSKVPDVVGFPFRTTLSWDGATEASIDALVVEADFAIGVRPEWNWAHPKQGPSLSAFLRALPRERDLPFPAPIDRALADEGRLLFEGTCARCHGTYGADGRPRAYTERVVSVGTDPARARALTDDFLRAANEPALTHGIVETRRTGGYVPPVLTSVWARAPYGHAGQWPSLAFIATSPERRAVRYVVDLDAPLDLDLVGFPARAEAREGGHLHDGATPGLGVQGHPFLADLGAPGARAVIEYLKTL